MLVFQIGDRPQHPDLEDFFNVITTFEEFDEEFKNVFALIEEGDFIELSNHLNEIVNDTNDRLEMLEDRFNKLAHGEAPAQDTRNGHRKYLWEFFDLISADSIEGYKQQMTFFSNALGGKIDAIDVESSTGITISLSNPQRPRIVQNKPLWANIAGKPAKYDPIAHVHPISDVTGLNTVLNQKADLDINGKVPVSQTYSSANFAIIVNNISERNALIPTFTGVVKIFVRDASGDPTVSLGSAEYLWDHPNTAWIKTGETESLDIIQSWANVTGKPTEFTPAAHTHTKTEVGLGNVNNTSDADKPISTATQTALNGKRNSGNVPASEVTEDGDRYFVSFNEKRLWNNQPAAGGSVSGNVSASSLFAQNRTAKFTLIGNTTITSLGGGSEMNVYVIHFTQDATGGRTITLPSNVKIPSGESIDTGANKKSVLTLLYDGTDYLGSWKKGWV